MHSAVWRFCHTTLSLLADILIKNIFYKTAKGNFQRSQIWRTRGPENGPPSYIFLSIMDNITLCPVPAGTVSVQMMHQFTTPTAFVPFWAGIVIVVKEEGDPSSAPSPPPNFAYVHQCSLDLCRVSLLQEEGCRTCTLPHSYLRFPTKAKSNISVGYWIFMNTTQITFSPGEWWISVNMLPAWLSIQWVLGDLSHVPPSNVRVKMCGDLSPLPHIPFWCGA